MSVPHSRRSTASNPTVPTTIGRMSTNVAVELKRRGGLATRRALQDAGCSKESIVAFVHSGQGRVIRRCWLASGADADAVRAVELGGALTAGSALRTIGVWVSHDRGLCVAVPRSSSRLPPLNDGESRYRSRNFRRAQGAPWRVSAVMALVQLASMEELPHVVASVDSALHSRAMSTYQLDELFAALPRRWSRMRKLVNAEAESGLESILRVALVLAGLQVEVQVSISGVGRVDLVVNGWLVVETDGDRWHSSREQRERDRRRDAALVRRGMRQHRFGHGQIMDDLEGCVDVVRELLASRP